MSRKTFKLSIEESCQENWEAMNPQAEGRHCGLCTKTVLDFTQLSDQEVLQLIKKYNGKVCGRLRQSQLNRLMVLEEQRSGISTLYKILAGMALVVLPELAETGSLKATETIRTQQEMIYHDTVETWPSDTFTYKLSGRVVDADSLKPMASVFIQISNTEIQTRTDTQGCFSLSIPANSLSDTTAFSLSSMGYLLQNIPIQAQWFNQKREFILEQAILMFPADIEIEPIKMGKIHYDPTPEKKKKGKDKRQSQY